MSTKQQLQRNRAYFKFVLSGLNKPIVLESLSPLERTRYARLLEARDEILNDFDITSKSMGLNVPEHKCWCGKKATVQKLETNIPGMQDLIWVCNKHKNN